MANTESSSKTLAQLLQELREKQGITTTRLAELANLPVKQIQDLEAGLELFLSPAIRQKIARVLKVRPAVLKAFEKMALPENPPLSHQAREQYLDEIMHYPNQEHLCPLCQAPLTIRLFNRRDLEDNLLLEVKAHCSKCLFKL